MASEWYGQWNSSWIDGVCKLVSQEIVEWRLEIAHTRMMSSGRIHSEVV